jgi:hypothetical protein
MPEYYGYPNQPTWSVALWVDNDAGMDEDVRDMARGILEEGASAYALADLAKEYVEALVEDENASGLSSGLGADLLGWALAQVDWQFLANEWLEEAKAEKEEEDSND